MFILAFIQSGWIPTVIIALSLMVDVISAYRPVQHCKHIGENGHYSACTALTQTYNASTAVSDLYLRYHWYRYKDQKHGWHALAIGEQMAGAYMLVMYGDTTAPNGPLTVSVRTADGHHPPRPVQEFSQFDDFAVPTLEIVTAKFEEYTGPFYHENLELRPSHMGIVEAIIRGYGVWPGTAVDNSSTHQAMLWSSNYQQDFSSDYSADRNLDAHMFGLGFGFLWVDMLNAETPSPMFGPIDVNGGLKGVNEIRKPDAPTEEELTAGQLYIASVLAASPSASVTQALSAQSRPTPVLHSENPSVESSPTELPHYSDSDKIPNHTSPDANTQDEESPPIEQPVRTVLGKTLRDWMWHLHGLLMIGAFLILYPLGVYLLRRPPPNGNGFNLHWTIQALASVSAALGAIIGYVNSYGISILHQYIGLSMVLVIAIQLGLGWRHHVIFSATKRKTLFRTVHMWTGRTILPVGFVNIILGMMLRRYGRLTMILVGVAIFLETGFLAYILLGPGSKNARIDTGRATRTDATVQQDDAEEYFQLGGEDDDDEFSEDDGEAAAARGRQGERREQAERLSRLDRV